jgi:hypothetical protein
VFDVVVVVFDWFGKLLFMFISIGL